MAPLHTNRYECVKRSLGATPPLRGRLVGSGQQRGQLLLQFLACRRASTNLVANCVADAIFGVDVLAFDDFLKLRRQLMAEKIRRCYEGL
jgi:hypothetical protein